MASSEWLCGVPGRVDVVDDALLDFSPCYRNLLLYGVPFAYIVLCGAYHTINEFVKKERRTKAPLRVVEWIVFAFSLVMVAFPWVNMWNEYDTVANPGNQMYLAASFHSAGWLISMLIFRFEITLKVFTPSYTLYGFWALELLAAISAMRSSVQTFINDDDLSSLTTIDYLTLGQTIVVSFIWFVSAFMYRRTPFDTPSHVAGGTNSNSSSYSSFDDEYTKADANGRNGFNKVRRPSSGSGYSINSGDNRGNVNAAFSPRVSKRGNFISRMSPRSGGSKRLNYKDEPLLKTYESSSSSEEETGAQKRRRMRRSRDLENGADHRAHYEGHSSLISILTFNWMSPLFGIGYKDQLKYSEFMALMPSDKTDVIGDEFERRWEFEQARAADKFEDGKPTQWSLVRALMKGFGKEFYIAGLMKVLSDLLTFVSPQLLSVLIQFVNDPDIPEWHGYAYAGLLFVSAIVTTALLHQYFHRVFRVGMWLKTALLGAVYKKALRLSGSARQSRTTGEIVNLMSTDSQRIQDLFPYLHTIWSAPLQISLAIFFLWQEVGVSVLVGLGVMLGLMVPTNVVIVRKIKVIQKALMGVKDTRIKVTNEALASMKVIKLYAWEPSFNKKIAGIRDEELALLRAYVILNSIVMTLWNSTPALVALATFASYVLLGNDLTADRAFTALALFNIIRFPLTMLPMIINNSIEAAVSLNRLVKFFNANELTPPDSSYDPSLKIPRNAAIAMQNCTYFWDDARESKAIDDTSFVVHKKQLAMIVGRVGSGKTAIMSALIGDLVHETGHVRVSGSVAYTSQNAWIQNASLRDNILFGEHYNKKWYDKVVYACALKPDLEMLPGGDSTEIGEKGINLSGGQKQRVALARAVYKRAEVYLLDDTLSAVDAHVGQHIMRHCILGLLGDKTVLFATNSVHFLKHADLIAVVEDGRVLHQGSFNELMSDDSGFDLAALLHADSDDEAGSQDGGDASAVAGVSPRLDEGTIALLDDQEDEKERAASALEADNSEDDEDDENAPPVHLTLDDTESAKAALARARNLQRRGSAGSVVSAMTVGSEPVSPPNNTQAAVSKDGKIGGQLIDIEKRERGSVKWAVYKVYIIASGGMFIMGLLMASLLGRQGAEVGTSRWLAYWSDETQAFLDGINPEPTDTGFYLGIYSTLNIVSILFVIVNLVIIAIGRLKASRNLHTNLLDSLLRAPMSFFDTTPIGRILNRFASDMYSIDNLLPTVLFSYLSCVFQVVTTIGVIVVISYYFAVALVPLSIIYWWTQNYYITTSRDLKRWASVLNSPVYSNFSETLDGVSVIRAFGASQRFTMENEEKVDNWLLAFYPSIAANRWLAVRLEFVGTCVVGLASVLAVTQRETISGGLAGMSITYALSVTQTLNWLVRMTADRENQVVAVERVKEYTDTPSEAPLYNDKNQPPRQWPQHGKIEFRDYKMRYRPELELVIRGLNATIQPQEKIGVVGRTGAGKSSLFNCLLRVIEAADGQILIDGIDIAKVGLHDVRKNVTIIPQDPVLFTGTIRFNLDPFNASNDDEMWEALRLAHLDEHIRSLELKDKETGNVSSPGLDYEVSEGGSNFSSGQRQLLCMARALLRKSKILLLDEATSAVDVQTDRLIQDTIRQAFAKYTVLTIAHRLDTIMDSSRVMVMDAGKIKEFDQPQKLLADESSAFFAIAQAAFGHKKGSSSSSSSSSSE